jgi:hypothetical protein
MSRIEPGRMSPEVAEKVEPFFEEILKSYPENIHSIHLVGSAVTEDFVKKVSDVNSVFVLEKMDLKFLELVAPLGRKHKKKGVAAPLIMTPEYINRSLDVFPVEFLDFKLIHQTVSGEDLLAAVEIDRSDLRHQCEREIKSKLIGLRQGYISSLGDRKMLTEHIVSSIVGYMPLFRGIIFLMGQDPPVRKNEVIKALSDATGLNLDIIKKILDARKGKIPLTKAELNTVFEEYYRATEEIGEVVDDLQV